MHIRLAAAVPVLLTAGVLAAGAPALSQAADRPDTQPDNQPDNQQGEPRIRAAEQARAATAPCVGGAQRKSFTGGHADWFATTSTTTVPGSTFQFRGPSSGKDTVHVNLSAFDTFAETGQYGQARVLLDGVDMAPASAATEYFNEADNYSATAGQYCAKVGSGNHRVRLVLTSYYGGNVYLFNPMLHVEVAH